MLVLLFLIMFVAGCAIIQYGEVLTTKLNLPLGTILAMLGLAGATFKITLVILGPLFAAIALIASVLLADKVIALTLRKLREFEEYFNGPFKDKIG